jgi:hypothetical protein
VDWLAVTLLGACGGAIPSLLDITNSINSWKDGRNWAHRRPGTKPPKLTPNYIDPPADSLSLATRVLLGALAGLAFRNQIEGVPAALAAGAAAPALLRQLGSLRKPDNAPQVGQPQTDVLAQVEQKVKDAELRAKQAEQKAEDAELRARKSDQRAKQATDAMLASVSTWGAPIEEAQRQVGSTISEAGWNGSAVAMPPIAEETS